MVMNSFSWFRRSSYGALLALLIPFVCTAQLSSTNYQVEVFGVGEEGGGTATSSQYRVDGSVGSALEYSPASSAPAGTSPGGSGGSRRADGDVSLDTGTASTVPAIIPVGAEFIPPPTERVNEQQEFSEAPALNKEVDIVRPSFGDTGSSESADGSISSVTDTSKSDCASFLSCYGWAIPVVLFISILLYWYRRRST
jgi:hypothetical protein